MIRLWTLGIVDLRGSDGRSLDAILAQPKRFALLVYLAINCRRGLIRRDQILALFWPELDPKRARAALNRALYYLRRSLGANVLLSVGNEEIGISRDDFWCDATAFENAAREQRPRDAVDLYQGELLEGFHISDAPDFASWVERERNHLNVTACRCAWALADADEAAGNLLSTARWATWACERLPYDETGLRRLLRLLERSGDRAGAVHTYEKFVRRIAEELELSPSTQTTALISSIRSRQTHGDTRAADQAGIVPALANTSRTAFTERKEVETEGVAVKHGRVRSRGVRLISTLASLRRSAALHGKRLNWTVALPVLVVGIACYAFVATRKPNIDPRLVLVTPFRNMTGDSSADRQAAVATEWITRSVTDLLETTVSPPRISRVDLLGRPAIRISVAMYRESSGPRFHARVDDLRTRSAWVLPPMTAAQGSPASALRELSERLAGAVAVLLNPCHASWLTLETTPPVFDAYTEFVRGNYRQAAQLDSTFTWAALYALAREIRETDGGPMRRRINDARRAKADSIAEILAATRPHVASLQRHWLDATIAFRLGNRDHAYRATREAVRLAPGAQFIPRFAWGAASLNHPRESMRLLEDFEPDPACGNANGRNTQLAESYHQLRQHRRELDLARRARRQTNDLGTLYGEVRARAARGEVSRVMALLDSALSYPTIADYSPGGIMLMAAEEFRGHGHPEAAAEALERTIAWLKARPVSQALRDLFIQAGAMYYAGRWDEADSLALAIVGQSPVQWAEILGFRGAIAARRGDRDGARGILAALDGIERFPERPVSELFYAEARIQALLGDAEDAVSSLRDWIGGQGFDLHTAIDFEPIANFAPYREFVRPKG